MGSHLQRTVTALGDLYDRVGVLDKVAPPREGHKENPIDVGDSEDEVEVKREEPEVEVGALDKGKGREKSRSPPRSRVAVPKMTGEGPRGRPQALDWLEDIQLGPHRESRAGPSRRGQRATRGRPYSCA